MLQLGFKSDSTLFPYVKSHSLSTGYKNAIKKLFGDFKSRWIAHCQTVLLVRVYFGRSIWVMSHSCIHRYAKLSVTIHVILLLQGQYSFQF